MKDTYESHEQRIQKVLFDFGMPEHLEGHIFLTDAIKMSIMDPFKDMASTYKEVAEKYGKGSFYQVERSIRYAIELLWQRGDTDIMHKWFGSTISSKKKNPTNQEFIRLIANRLRQ